MAQEHGISVECRVTTTPVVTDPLRVRQILANLLSNAIKYTPAGGAVEVCIARDGSGAKPRVGVEVRDTGRGIPVDLRGHLFEEFFRVRDDESSIPGNGLGLAMSRRLARLLDGDVTYAENAPSGSVFTLWLNAR
jgi:signal transduction histidine kinase